MCTEHTHTQRQTSMNETKRNRHSNKNILNINKYEQREIKIFSVRKMCNPPECMERVNEDNKNAKQQKKTKERKKEICIEFNAKKPFRFVVFCFRLRVSDQGKLSETFPLFLIVLTAH